jgi:hypothetical protein
MENLSRKNSIFKNPYNDYIIFDNRKSIDEKRDCQNQRAVSLSLLRERA